jgi:hypothetical protein
MNRGLFICPLTGLEMNGTFKFFALFNCGCVFSERAYKTIQSSTKLNCLKCEKPFTLNDLIILNPNDKDDLEQNKTKCEKRKEIMAKAKAEKIANKNAPGNGNVTAAVKTSSSETVAKSSSKRSIDSIAKEDDSKPKVSGLNGACGSSMNNNAKKVKSVQDDPTASNVYKSLFTSCDKAKNQQKAHWVTFNPQYF